MADFDSFFTTVVPKKAQNPLGVGEQVMAVGSCFARHVKAHLEARGFRAVPSAMGLLYNPLSMAKCLSRVLDGGAFEPEDIHQDGQNYVSFDHDGSYGGRSAEGALLKMNQTLNESHAQIGHLQRLILTLGTAFVYEKADFGVVANCHHFPRTVFQRRCVGVKEGTAALLAPLKKWMDLNPALKIIVTVSPVRHLRDDATENSLSKAILRLIADRLCQLLPRASYFPAFEIVLDELRDYRFFGPDRAHLTDEAVAHVMEKFESSHWSKEAKALSRGVLPILKGLKHRSRSPGSDADRLFLRGLADKIAVLERKHPDADLGELRRRLNLRQL